MKKTMAAHPDSPTWDLAEAFDRAAPSYDAMVALSPGYHAQLLRSAQALLRQSPAPTGAPLRMADLGCGSGASTQALLEVAASARSEATLQVTGVDASAGMLAEARRKEWPEGVTFIEKDALAWLQAQPSASLDAVLAAYLLRNVPDRESVVREVARVLAPGGVVAIQDYSVSGQRLARGVWAGVCYGMIVPLAVVKRSDVPLHTYLYRSVRDFDSVEQIQRRLSGVGLRDVRHVRHTGWQRSMVHTVTAVAP